MTQLARYRKALLAALGVAATIAATIPTDSPAWRTAQVILGLATIAGVYGVRNAPPTGRGTTYKSRHTPDAGYPDEPPSAVGEELPPGPDRTDRRDNRPPISDRRRKQM